MIQLGLASLLSLFRPFLRQTVITSAIIVFHGRISFVENVGDDFAIAIDAEDELREIVRVNCESVEDLGDLVHENDVARDLACDVNL